MALRLIPQAYAQCDPGQDGGVSLSDCLPLNRQGDLVSDVYTNPSILVNLLVRNVFVVSGLVIFLMIVYAGFLFIQDTAKGKDKALEIAQNALLGFVVLFGAYWVVQLVQILTGTNFGI